MKDRIRLHIASEELPKDVKKSSKISALRYMYSIDIKNKKEINAELIKNIKQSFMGRDKNARV